MFRWKRQVPARREKLKEEGQVVGEEGLEHGVGPKGEVPEGVDPEDMDQGVEV
ncbi:hypothetical protein DPMN_035683 [Dreissena polymorpha]|uniref:Uncharacterized protein n=1 Tax=Dreissena polymorpha TaxID=45954 RepID=A0A9D4M7R8_DREPO|nr:hypothetical protein DPMN_035683 [Dreissena polymorpha]